MAEQSAESPQPQENLPAVPPPTPPATKKIRHGFWETVKDSLFEYRPEAKPWRVFFGERMAGMKLRKWVALSLAAIVLAAVVWYPTYCVEKKNNNLMLDSTNTFYAHVLEATNLFFSNSNSFLSGQIDTLNHQVSGIQNQFQDYKRESESQVNALKTDNAKVTGERDNALLRVAQLESLSTTAQLLYSNSIALNGQVSSDQSYELKINGLALTNYILGQAYVIPLKKSREIYFEVSRLKEWQKSVEKITLDFVSALDPTNLIVDTGEGHWRYKVGRFETFSKNDSVIEIVAQNTLTSASGFGATSFNVSTNVQAPFFPARIDLFAPGTVGVQSIVVNFSFQ